MFNFFTQITHALATFIVSALIATGLATIPVVATNTPSTQTVVSANSSIIASTTETTSVPIEVPPTSSSPQPKTNLGPAPSSPQSTAPSTPVVTTTDVVPAIAPQTITITIKPDTAGITSAGLQAFYNISSDSNSEVDIKTVEATITGVQAPTNVLTSITNDTQQELLMASSQSASVNPATGVISIMATLNKPLIISSGYPTLFDISVPEISATAGGNPVITITSVGSSYILKSGGAVYLSNTATQAAEATGVSYWLANHTCVGLQGVPYSSCVNYGDNH